MYMQEGLGEPEKSLHKTIRVINGYERDSFFHVVAMTKGTLDGVDQDMEMG